MIKRTYFFLNIFLFTTSFILAQEEVFLNQKKDQIIQEIKYIKDQINQAELDKQSNLNTLLLYEKNIELRDSLIKEYEKDIGIIETSLDSLSQSLHGLYKKETNLDLEITNIEIKISTLSHLLSQAITQIYLSHKHEELLYVFHQKNSVDNILNQYIYLQTIQNTARTLSKKLKLEKLTLDTLKESLKKNKVEIEQSIGRSNKLISGKKLFVSKKENQRDSLTNQRRLKEDLVNSLGSKIKSLKEEIIIKEERAKKIENEIIKLSRENLYNQEDNILFEKNKGLLNWPAEEFVIMSSFGEVSHPSLPGIKSINHGIELAVSKNSFIKSVFSGKVCSIIVQNNSLRSVIVEHGDYRTVYTKLGEVNVKLHDIIQENQIIGKAYIKENHKTGFIEFQIWKGFESQDPKIWLKKH